MNPIRTRDVRVGELHPRLSESGDPRRQAVPWLHGSGPGATALSNLEGVISELSGDFHNLAPDVIGLGDSSHPDPAPQGMVAYTTLRVETLLRLLDSLGLVVPSRERVSKLVLMRTEGAPLPPTQELIKLVTFYTRPSCSAQSRPRRWWCTDEKTESFPSRPRSTSPRTA